MKIEIDTSPTTPKFVVDGHPLDSQHIVANPSVSLDSDSYGPRVSVEFIADEVVYSTPDGVTTTLTAKGITFSGTDEQAVRRAAGLA